MENQQKLDIDDGSGDKDFFTIIPNYILNNSSSLDQSLYIQLKRLAGDGKRDYCYPSFRYLKKQLKVGETNLKKSFQYLIKNKWIDSLGKRKVRTRGGYQWVSAYRINNIWKLNTAYYQGVSNQGHPKENKVSPENSKVSLRKVKVSPVVGAKQELLKKELLKKELIATQALPVNLLIEKFKTINPSYERLFSNKTQRASIERMLKKFGQEKLEKIIDSLSAIFGQPYSPTITTPYLLEKKMGDLIAYIQKRSQEKVNFIDLSKK